MGGFASCLAALVLAGCLAAEGGLHAAAAALPEAVVSAVGSRTEADAVAAIDGLSLQDLRQLPFEQVERLVRLSWWQAAVAVVTKSHEARMDFTAPVRRAVQDVKKEADLLLKWLDPRFANPGTTPMAMRWAQNTTAVVVAARFAPKWEAPGANLGVFSTEKGRGHVDPQKTAERIKSMLRVNISARHIEAEITADSANVRKRYTLRLDLFDEVVPERSAWTLEFRRAQGSMQMSTGAQIPELQFHLRKRWPGTRRWPRTSPSDTNESSPVWWADAPGLSDNDTAALREGTPLVETALTCERARSVYCRAADTCVASCGGDTCPGAAVAHASSSRCVALPQPGNCSALLATFLDEDLEQGTLGGAMRWSNDAEAAAELFDLRWAAAAALGEGQEPLPDLPALALLPASVMDPEPSFTLPPGTALPPGAGAVLIFASNEAGRSLLACAVVEDRVRPPPPLGLRFLDEDPRRGVAGGEAEVNVAADDALVLGYELRWGRDGAEQRAPEPAEVDEPPIAVATAADGERVLRLALPEVGVRVPKGMPWLLAFSVGPGGARSAPAAVRFSDAAPPTVAAARLTATADAHPKARVASTELTVQPGNCDTSPGSKGRGGVCDLGTEYAVYWKRANGSKLGDLLGTAPAGQKQTLYLESLAMPSGATGLIAVSRNVHGEMSLGPTVEFPDNRSESASVWSDVTALAACTSGSVAFWHPLGTDEVAPMVDAMSATPIDVSALRIRGITAVALGRHGKRMALGQEDGSVSFVDWVGGRWSNVQTVAGPGAVTSLAFDGEGLRMLRGARFGQLDLWTLSDGHCTAHLTGHTDAVHGLDVDWAGGRAISASGDGTVRLWDLATGTLIRTMEVETVSMQRAVADWSASLVLVALADETLRLFDLATGAQLWALEGHSEPVWQLSADFGRARALSISSDRVAKLWDLESRECLLTFGGADILPIVAVNVSWEHMEALTLLDDATAVLWDLHDGSRHVERGHACGVRAGVATLA